MRHRIKYLLTFLTSVALTFHFLLSRTLHANKKGQNAPNNDAEKDSGEGDSLGARPRLARESRSPDLQNSGWIILPGNVTVHVGEEENKENPNYLLAAESVCTDLEDVQRLKLVVFVASKVQNSAQRQAIRDTWALKALQEALNFRVVFVLGYSDEEAQKLVAYESLRYGDVVQTEATETFHNLGRKTFAGLLWSTQFCSNAEFVMKTDDDILVHIPNLMNAVREARDPETLLLCHENRMRKILRKDLLNKVPENYGKYEVSTKELPGLYYPPYCSGMAYVFSHEVRDRLLQASLVTPLFFIEDVYLTGFCRYKAGVRITPHDGITLRPSMTPDQAVCSFSEGRITSQEVGVEELRSLWAERNTRGFFCPKLVGYAHRRWNISKTSDSEVFSSQQPGFR